MGFWTHVVLASDGGSMYRQPHPPYQHHQPHPTFLYDISTTANPTETRLALCHSAIMGAGDNLMLKLDETVTHVFGQWDIYTTGIFVILITFFAYQVINTRDPDAHPMLLARQAQASPVRQEGESSVFRSHSAPHGVPLNAGLNVKDPGDSKWTRGRNGDLRDVWRQVVTGPVDHEGKSNGEPGKIMTVFGTESIIQHNLGTAFPRYVEDVC
jgi:hypothetical protein